MVVASGRSILRYYRNLQRYPARYFGEIPEVEGLLLPIFQIYVQAQFHRSNLLIGFQGVLIRFLKAPLDASRALWELARGYK